MLSSESIAEVTWRIRAEFDECLGMQLTEPQFRLLFNMDSAVCKAILTGLCESGFLVEKPTGVYRKVISL